MPASAIILTDEQGRLRETLGIPVECPLEDGVESLVPVLREYLDGERARRAS